MAAATTPKTYNDIKLIDPTEAIWVSPTNGYETHLEEVKHNHGKTYIILIGPTGSGKSSFIEAITAKSTREPLGIAKDQLESVTQEPCIYEIRNLQDMATGKIYIIDTPGFADPRISELQVLDKLIYWRDMCQESNGYIRLLYFHPITDIRMPASRKQCLDMIRNFWGLQLSIRTTLVTSFWDRVPERSRIAAETRFTQLHDKHWGDWIQGGSSVVKFENTFDSAMDIIDKMCDGKKLNDDYPSVVGLGMEGASANPIYESLSSRLSALAQKQQLLREDLAHPESQGRSELISLLSKDLVETDLLLQKFSTEMEDFLKRFGPPPAIQPSATAEVMNAATIEMGVVDSASRSTDVTVIDPASNYPVDPTITTSCIAEDIGAIEPRQVSLPQRFGKWVDKKLNKIHLDRFGRKGA